MLIKFSHPKRHFLAQNIVVWRIKRENPSNDSRLQYGRSEELKKWSKHSKVLGVYLAYMGKTLGRLTPNFLVVDIRDVITCFKFGDDRFRGLASAEGQILQFPIDFDGRPCNTHTTVWACDHRECLEVTTPILTMMDVIVKDIFQHSFVP